MRNSAQTDKRNCEEDAFGEDNTVFSIGRYMDMKCDKGMQIHLLYTMILIREFETKVSEMKNKNLVFGSVHCCDGEEAIAAGVCSALNADDYIVSNHRPHGHAIAKGVSIDRMMAELLGKATGTNGGKGGSMHINDPAVGMINATGIVASGLPVACGAAYAAKFQKDGRIACVFFGDGSANEGIVHECLNLASVWDLPVLFVLEDNDLAVTTNTNKTSACQDYVKLADVYGIGGAHSDGQHVEEVYIKSCEAVEYIRKNSRPYFLQFKTIRFREHAEGEYYARMINKQYRDYDRLTTEIKNRCPIALYSAHLMKTGVLTEADIQKIRSDVNEKLQYSLEFANKSPLADTESAFEGLYVKERES